MADSTEIHDKLADSSSCRRSLALSLAPLNLSSLLYWLAGMSLQNCSRESFKSHLDHWIYALLLILVLSVHFRGGDEALGLYQGDNHVSRDRAQVVSCFGVLIPESEISLAHLDLAHYCVEDPLVGYLELDDPVVAGGLHELRLPVNMEHVDSKLFDQSHA